MIIVTIVIDAILLYWGYRKLKGKHRLLKWLLYCSLIGWSTYLHICNFMGITHVSLSTPFIKYIQPVGQAIIRWLGG